MNRARSISVGVIVSLMGLSGCASSRHHGGGAIPIETGQGAFGALAEVVSILEQDPNTDWSKVDISGLRRHLVDMNALTLNAQVKVEARDESIVFRVSGAGETLRAIQAMVPSHAAQLSRSFQWETETSMTPDGATLALKASDPEQLQRFRALGFFGIMATGSHHQMHHLQMATGQGHAQSCFHPE